MIAQALPHLETTERIRYTHQRIMFRWHNWIVQIVKSVGTMSLFVQYENDY